MQLPQTLRRNARHPPCPDDQPRLKRIAPAPSAGSTRIAASTCERATLPEEQAAPDETAIPARSSAMTSVSALTPGMAKYNVLGRRSTACPKMIASGAALATCAAKASRNLASRAGSLAASATAALAAAPRAPNPPPPRHSRSRPAVPAPDRRRESSGSATLIVGLKRRCRAPAPFGPPILWADRMRKSSPLIPSAAQGARPASCTASQTSTPPVAWTKAPPPRRLAG